MTVPDTNLVWGKIVAAALWQAGVRIVCLSPGSRSTPLVLGLYLFGAIEVIVHVDERSAAFFALGMAKARRQPIALLCTSGTAAANYFPAVIEANYSQVPLVILTADRPPELRNCGSPQTIDQMHLFGNHVRFFFEVGVPIASQFHFRYLESLVQYSVAIAVGKMGMPGPVHLNFPFAEPLTPLPIPDLPPGSQTPRWQGLATETHLSTTTINILRATLQINRKGVFVVGVGNFLPELAPLLKQVAHHLGYPILGESTGICRDGVISHYDSFLRSVELVKLLSPQIILRFGAMPTSKGYLQWLERYPDCQQILIGKSPNTDPTHGQVGQIAIDEISFCQQLLECLANDNFTIDGSWQNSWETANQTTAQVLEAWMAKLGENWFEGKIYYELAQWLPDQTILHIANSTPIRDLDTFFHGNQNIKVFANRGANGIDGTISSALGIACHNPNPVLLVCGDLSFYHDLNGLLVAQRYGISLTIILIDNQGGGIFEMLPIAQLEPFESYFATPIGIDFAAIVGSYGGKFLSVKNWQEFQEVTLQALLSPGVKVIYVKTDRKRDWELRRSFWKIISRG